MGDLGWLIRGPVFLDLSLNLEYPTKRGDAVYSSLDMAVVDELNRDFARLEGKKPSQVR